MSNCEWPANDYAIGSFIQASVAERFLPELQLNHQDRILDVGCGNGSFTRKILNKIPEGSLLGIDASENMLELAKAIIKEYPNFSVAKADVLALPYREEFDAVVSFWCLQWAKDIYKAFDNMVNTLKSGGKMYALLPAGDDPYITTYYALKKSGKYPQLNDFQAPVDYSRLENLADRLSSLPCNRLHVERIQQSIKLPSLDIFRKFVNGIAFYQQQFNDAEVRQLNEAMVLHYDQECKAKYNGDYLFNCSIYWVTGEK
jgi:ubiquinone/menaquinone biosynthesis C-methylase UbiE